MQTTLFKKNQFHWLKANGKDCFEVKHQYRNLRPNYAASRISGVLCVENISKVPLTEPYG